MRPVGSLPPSQSAVEEDAPVWCVEALAGGRKPGGATRRSAKRCVALRRVPVCLCLVSVIPGHWQRREVGGSCPAGLLACKLARSRKPAACAGRARCAGAVRPGEEEKDDDDDDHGGDPRLLV